jgi:hypothetical protein
LFYPHRIDISIAELHAILARLAGAGTAASGRR